MMSQFWKFLLIAVLAACHCICVASDDPVGNRRLNVLFIAVDDLAVNLGCYGDVVARTPQIDRLATTAVRFDRAYNQIPLCNPSRASVLTGLRPDHTGVYDLSRHFRQSLPEVVTLPQAFQQAGYFAARVGKIYHYDVPTAIGSDGFDDRPSWNLTVNPKGRDKIDESLIYNAEPHRAISGALSWLAAEGTDEEQTDGMIATEAIRLLAEHRHEPFFLGVGFFRPHTPYVAPKRYFDLYPKSSLRLPYAPSGDRDDVPMAAFAHNCPVPNYGLDESTLLAALQAYYACTSLVDTQVGRLLSALDELGLTEKTIVVLWSDHGYHLGEHDGVWQKRTLFEQGARAPLIIRVPGAAGNGQASPRVVEFVDIFPTLAAVCGLNAPHNLDGRNLTPLLQDPIRDWDSIAITQVLRPADSRFSQPVMGRSARDERFRYTQWNGGQQGVELYDHASDPNEFRNLATDPQAMAAAPIQAVVEKLGTALDRHARAQPTELLFEPSRL